MNCVHVASIFPHYTQPNVLFLLLVWYCNWFNLREDEYYGIFINIKQNKTIRLYSELLEMRTKLEFTFNISFNIHSHKWHISNHFLLPFPFVKPIPYYLCHMNTVIMRLNTLNINKWVLDSDDSRNDVSSTTEKYMAWTSKKYK